MTSNTAGQNQTLGVYKDLTRPPIPLATSCLGVSRLLGSARVIRLVDITLNTIDATLFKVSVRAVT